MSTDGVAYSKVAAVDTQAHPAEGVTVNFDEVSARYVRIVADYYVTPQQFSFREVEVYGVVGGGDTHEHTYGDWQTNGRSAPSAAKAPQRLRIPLIAVL